MTKYDLPLIDVDTHIAEPQSLWRDRLSRKWGSAVPRVGRRDGVPGEYWRIGDTWLSPVGAFAGAGSSHYPSQSLLSYEEMDEATWVPSARLRRMDEDGVYAQVVHPNLLGMETAIFLAVGKQFATECVCAYNDFVMEEYADPADGRFIPVAVIPFWDIDAAVTEFRRACGMGHRGVLFGNDSSALGYPGVTDSHWDPIYAVAEELGVPVIAHAGFFESDIGMSAARATRTDALRAGARIVALGMTKHVQRLAMLLTGELCERFPSVKFVAAESGIGYMTYMLEALDWNWKVHGVHRTGATLPSEVFRRQFYATFWFEEQTAPMLDSYSGNFMFQTDYPHGNGMVSGPVSPGDRPSRYATRVASGIDPNVARQVFYQNAADLYGVERRGWEAWTEARWRSAGPSRAETG